MHSGHEKRWLAACIKRRLTRMEERLTPAEVRLQRCNVEHPFAMIKNWFFGHPRLLIRAVRFKGLNRPRAFASATLCAHYGTVTCLEEHRVLYCDATSIGCPRSSWTFSSPCRERFLT